MAKGPKKSRIGGQVRTHPIPWTGSVHYTEQRGYPERAGAPPQWLLDKLADEQISGGYTSRNKLCPRCRTKMPNTGQCDWCN